jgi:predicted enzyme related to lactoylglutathione lyase
MSDDELMTIGRFANLSCVSVHALRHYDEVGLLAPAEVDGDSGYRRYRADQIQRVRLIRSLRWMDLPIEELKQVLSAPSDDAARAVLEWHRGRLEREHNLTGARLRDVNRFLDRGLEAPVILPGCRPVQIKMTVADQRESVAFYQSVLGLRFDVAQRTSHADYSSFLFGEYGRQDFFLIWLLDDQDRTDRPGPANVSFLVNEVDGAHRRALEAGAAEVTAPRSPEDQPRHSAVRDPDGNRLGLVEDSRTCRPFQLVISVADARSAADFYAETLGLSYADGPGSSLAFGNFGQEGFFLLRLADDPDQFDRPGPANFSFLVDDLDAVHSRALAAGASLIEAPRNSQGMPRNSAVRDPSGNWVGLVQG